MQTHSRKALPQRDIFEFISLLVNKYLGFSKAGMKFLLTGDDEWVDETIWFLINVAPPALLFVVGIQLLAYWGWTQWLVGKFAYVFFATMEVSGAEAVVATASPILGSGEGAMMIIPYLPYLTDSEIHQVMCSGLSCVAGSVLYAFISMGVSGKILISSSLMSIPASLAVSKLRYPEKDEPLTAGSVEIHRHWNDDEDEPQNALHAMTASVWLGLKIAGTICATIMVAISLVALVDAFLGWWGSYLNAPDLTMSKILSYPLYPVALICGISEDSRSTFLVAELIGTKIIANEFKAVPIPPSSA